jgi:3'-phosphoadenosine 5'-phosphosulfate sulfotransferase (PAPS reductase)/FAD synthetase
MGSRVQNVMYQTNVKLAKYAEQHDAILLSYSGGKDSLACLDLCRRHFKTVICFNMFSIPGLAVTKEAIRYAIENYGVTVLSYPHWGLFNALKSGTYRNPHWSSDLLPDVTLHHIHRMVMNDTGIDLIAHGGKSSDSLWRRRNMSVTSGHEEVIYPIGDWNKYEVIAYLSMKGIPLPKGASGSNSGIDLTSVSLFWLHDNHPEDFKILCKWFPYAEAVIYRRKWYPHVFQKKKTKLTGLK